MTQAHDLTMTQAHELILGGQRSGKSRCAEARARAWLDAPGRSAVLLATALAGDGDMRERIERHRADRAQRVPELITDEVPVALAEAVAFHTAPSRLVVIDCLTLWLTSLLMPMSGEPATADVVGAAQHALCAALQRASGPVLLVSNEIGRGVATMAGARMFMAERWRERTEMAILPETGRGRIDLLLGLASLALKRLDPRAQRRVFIAGLGRHVLDRVEVFAGDEIHPPEGFLEPLARAFTRFAAHPGESASSAVEQFDEVGDPGVFTLHKSYIAFRGSNYNAGCCT